ncbi:hypothetical protein [Thermodesulfatator atlanticus]|uniref:hypothetical protein n=1 Tax=Thermodesulfatator atlanticus TaxID=501497 RepID=UPI0003B7648C|nr:hypothetical protein [Thermodesulfatator atlanticus]
MKANLSTCLKVFSLYMAAAGLAHGGETKMASYLVRKNLVKKDSRKKADPPFPPTGFLFLLAT